MTWAAHRLQGRLGEFYRAWDALNDRLFDSHPLVSGEFIDRLLIHFPDPTVRLCVNTERGEVTGMCLLRPVRFGQWASYLPSQAQIGPTLLRAPVDLQGLVHSLPGWVAQVDLHCIDPRFSGAALAADASVTPASHTLTMSIDLRGDFDAYWAARSKGLRSNHRRYERRAVDDGLAPRFAVHTAAADIAGAVARYGELEAEGWKGRAGTALSPGSAQLDFYTGLMLSQASQGQALVHELWFGDRLVASRLVLAGGAMVAMLKTCHSEPDRRYAPGRLLLHEVVRDAFARWPGATIEFYTNASVDQLAWASSQHEIVHVSVLRNRLVDRLNNLRHRWAARQSASATETQVEVHANFGACPPDVQQLFAKVEGEHIGFSMDWYANLADSIAPDGQGVHIYVLRRDGKPVAALPVQMETTARRRLVALGNYYTTLYSPALEPGVETTVLTPLLKAACRDHAPVPLLQFGPMDPLSPAYAVLRASLRAAGLATYEYFCHGNWYLPVTTGWAEYLQQRHGQLRSTIRRMERKLMSDGARLEIITDPADAERASNAFEQAYARSWKRPEPYPDFMPGLIALGARRGWLRLGVLWHHESPIAAQCWFVANGRAEIYKLAYDESFKSLAPGTVLTAHLMRHVIDVDRVTEVDYLIGDEPYKSDWMSCRRERWGLVAYNRRTGAGLVGWLREAAARAVKR